MLKSKCYACINPSNFSIIYCIFRIRNGFLQILFFSFLKKDKNMTVALLFDWIKLGDPHYDIFTFLSTQSWKTFSIYFLKTTSCDLGIRYSFKWYGLEYDRSYISTCLFFQVPSILSKGISYLNNTLWIISCSYFVKCLFSRATLHELVFHNESPLWNMYNEWYSAHVCSSVVLFSRIFYPYYN